MSFPKILLAIVIVLFGAIGIMAWMKEKKAVSDPYAYEQQIELSRELEKNEEDKAAFFAENRAASYSTSQPLPPLKSTPIQDDAGDLHVDRIAELFNPGKPQLPIVETLTYHSKVAWLQGRPAWLADYASHYNTSRHFIARSLNKKADYLTQKINEGDRFTVLRGDKDLKFYLLLDISRCKLWFYYLDGNEKVLLKTYRVGLGRLDSNSISGSLTPVGKYTLGSKVAVFAPGMTGTYQNSPTEMVRVFGTRWIPFDKEVGECSAPSKGLGLHGLPWVENAEKKLVEDRNCISKYESDGCIRLAKEDIEEIFAIVITKPTTVEIVRNIQNNH